MKLPYFLYPVAVFLLLLVAPSMIWSARSSSMMPSETFCGTSRCLVENNADGDKLATLWCQGNYPFSGSCTGPPSRTNLEQRIPSTCGEGSFIVESMTCTDDNKRAGFDYYCAARETNVNKAQLGPDCCVTCTPERPTPTPSTCPTPNKPKPSLNCEWDPAQCSWVCEYEGGGDICTFQEIEDPWLDGSGCEICEDGDDNDCDDLTDGEEAGCRNRCTCPVLIDADGDGYDLTGVSEPGELHKLPSLGVARLHLDFKESKRVDEHGNQFRYRAKVEDAKGAKAGRWAWDVFLVSQ